MKKINWNKNISRQDLANHSKNNFFEDRLRRLPLEDNYDIIDMGNGYARIVAKNKIHC